MTIVLSPCLQFPASYCSPTEIVIDTWRRYHTMRVSFSQKEIGYFSTADRADRDRCREDYRYLKKLIYPLEPKRVNFDLNIGAEYLDAKVRKCPCLVSHLVRFLLNRNLLLHSIRCSGGFFDINKIYLLIISNQLSIPNVLFIRISLDLNSIFYPGVEPYERSCPRYSM